MMSTTQAKPTLFGYGLTTKAIAKKLGGGCTFFDDNVKEAFKDEEGNHILPSALFDADKSQLEVTTPSLKPNHPLIQSARNLLSEYDYFADVMPFSIWISGTNGKTTTTQMLTHLLHKRGAVSGGNIGTPLADLDTDAPIWVLESSSFTLHHTGIASPNIYLLLPITPDHLDWHETPQQYAADKLRPLLTMKEGELALIPKGLSIPQTNAYVVEYDSNEMLAEYFSLDASALRFKAAFLQDALLALAVTRVLFDEADYAMMNAFVLDAHRQEEFKDARERLWVNDSKATNMDATIQALKGYTDKHIHLILGGDDKGVDLTPLFEEMTTLSLTLYTIGTNNEKLLSLAAKYSIKALSCNTLSKAVEAIDKALTTSDVALLSPAAASLDQFTSYKHRGELFRDLVKNL
ncbi:MAG: UDP-N-acetylmuramoyl-L-alanine--D-glutamate ligase [Sulfurovum sp. 39-42-12]|jgi:UDP-N-acetylmuramoylalanine--D-glutamate ligase|nr:MAG: UDP-N-acetylmuramoyl-L-alanine--D-glutamate ligase [Sulfurovum sp. 35-42-20]OYZ26901.1 MAG: UDP-N-acetylmuramoyl-L-alanine--D-glutamate ligase [Sulfurovum sp. 16-42-52]OYZ49560.1 MAG: UDP-N-acetylmuramoyl-L-alanine--D-glutamate ligase [Sulfurovum sp. 24-42-9]OZA45900.1 MAG: UDP-N-acetylmuramoyl-L-alanine--D-glutamate ligase [Sulfurovum sp. 17-42-90]OZA59876.1 MAG: UDP-N-acetylmuramoyl-L-alanine--D-glutamate ligase [Sulfurovum sp. 39-42-12]